MANDIELARTLGDVARSLQHEGTLQHTLDAIVAAAVETIPGAGYAGLTVVRARREVHTESGTDALVHQVDQAQYDSGEGPCLDATRSERIVRLEDMAHERRWPRFTRSVVGLGVRSMLSFQLYVIDDSLGALNLYSRKPGAFDDESERIGLLFAAHAAVAMAGAQREHGLTLAASVRDLIGQAKGILMERHKITDDRAFHLLVGVSQRTNVKLVDVARYLVESGELEAPPRRPG